MKQKQPNNDNKHNNNNHNNNNKNNNNGRTGSHPYEQLQLRPDRGRQSSRKIFLQVSGGLVYVFRSEHVHCVMKFHASQGTPSRDTMKMRGRGDGTKRQSTTSKTGRGMRSCCGCQHINNGTRSPLQLITRHARSGHRDEDERKRRRDKASKHNVKDRTGDAVLLRMSKQWDALPPPADPIQSSNKETRSTRRQRWEGDAVSLRCQTPTTGRAPPSDPITNRSDLITNHQTSNKGRARYDVKDGMGQRSCCG